MLKRFKSVFKSVLLTLLAIAIVATPVLAAYSATYTIIESDGTDYDILPVLEDSPNTWMAANGFMETDALDTRIETLGGLERPHMVVSDKTLTTIAVPANSQTNLFFTTGNTDLLALDIITGYGGYETIPDAVALELGNEFEIDQKGYALTGDSNFIDLVHKRLAYSTSVTDTSEISGIIYFDEPHDLVPSAFNAWTDVDVSDHVPAYATGVVVHLVNTTNGVLSLGARINGSVNALVGDTSFSHGWTIVGIDANDIFEVFLEDATCHAYLVGFTGSDFTFKAVADDISLGVALAWTDIDLAVEAPDATGAVIVILNTDAGNERQWGVRMEGSGDNRAVDALRDGISWAVIGCDSSQVIEGYAETLNIDFYLVGYTTGNVNYNTNAVDKSLVAFLAWTDIDCSADTTPYTTHLIFEMVSANAGAGADDYGFRRNGSTEDFTYEGYKHFWAIVECDDGQIVEGYAENANVDFFLIGYIEGYVKSPIERQTIADTGAASGEHTIVTSISDDIDFDDWKADASVAVNVGAGMVPVMLLETQTLGAPAANVTFSGIDILVTKWDTLSGVTSRHLVVVVNAASPDLVADRVIYARFNGDAGANYNRQRVYGLGAGAIADVNSNQAQVLIGAIPGANFVDGFGGGVIVFPHAFNTTNHKTFITVGGAVENVVNALTGRWASANAITSLLFYLNAGDFATDSMFWLGVIDERYLVEEDLLVAPGTIDFNNIPQDGNDLCVIGYSRGTVAAVEDEIVVEVNADGVAANYNTQRLLGTAAVTSAATANNALCAFTSGGNATANAFGAFVGFINQYAEGTNDPHYLTLNGYHELTGPTYRLGVYSGRRNNVAAVTRVEFYGNGAANFATGTLFSLYRVPRYVIDRQELTGVQATISFTNIPQGYSALQLLVYGRSDLAALSQDVTVSFNTDGVAANYDTQTLDGTGAVVTAVRNFASQVLMGITAANEGANEFGGGIVTMPNYDASDRQKHYITIDGLGENATFIRSCRWEDNNPITQIDLTLVGPQNFVAGSIFELVGIMPDSLFTINIDGGDVEGIANGNITVNDVGTDWKLTQDNVMPYMDYYEHEVSGTLIVDYEPITIISNTAFDGTADGGGTTTTLVDAELIQANDYWNLALLTIITTTDSLAPEGETSVVYDFDAGTDTATFSPALTVAIDAGDTYTIEFGTLPDKEGVAQDARITWGVNPTGVGVALGGMVSSSQPTPDPGIEDVVSDILPEVGVSDWFEEPAVAGILLTNPLRPFVTMLSDNSTLTEIQAWRLYALAMILLVTVGTAAAVKSHLMITGIAAGAAIGVAVALTIFPMWALVFIIMAIIGGVIAERSPSL